MRCSAAKPRYGDQLIQSDVLLAGSVSQDELDGYRRPQRRPLIGADPIEVRRLATRWDSSVVAAAKRRRRDDDATTTRRRRGDDAATTARRRPLRRG
jgi:hypothetical protein